MPAPTRAILANIHEGKLDSTACYSKLNKTGKFGIPNQKVFHIPNVIYETNIEQIQPIVDVEHEVLIEDVQMLDVKEHLTIESSLEKEVIKTLIEEELKVPEENSAFSISNVDLNASKKKFKKKN